MSSSPREIGTLIVVVLRAKNLPNKRHIGKQDPYCSMRFNTETRRTKAVKRGGQHPEWDEEVRFSIFEDAEDELARTAGDKTPPPKDRFRNIKGGKSMRVCCYADDPREPDFIGEAQVDLTEALTKGEVDEWFTLQAKDKYAGEVYLELTFWAKEKPPAKKKAPRPSTSNPQYGGPGSFTPSSSASEIPAALRPNREASPTHSQAPDRRAAVPVPDSLKPSSSALGDLNLYIPPYNSQSSLGSNNSLTGIEPGRGGYDELGVMGPGYDHGRRDSFPPLRQDPPPSLYGHPSNGSISSHQSYQPPPQPYDPFAASSLAQSMSNMQIGGPPAPSIYSPTTPAPNFGSLPSQFGYGGRESVPPPFPQGPGYPPIGYGPPPSATPMPPSGPFQPGFAPQTPMPPPGVGNQTVRIVSSGFGPPPPIPTPMPFSAPPATPYQPPPNPSHTPFPQQHPYAPQQYQPMGPPPQGPPIQNGPPSFPSGPYQQPFPPQSAPPSHIAFPSQPQPTGPPPPQQYPQPPSPPRGSLPPTPQHQPTLQQNGPPQHQSTLPPPPQQQQYHPQQQQQQYPPQPQQGFPPPPPPLQHHGSSNGSRPLPTPQTSQGSLPNSQSPGFIPGAYPTQPAPNGQQWQMPTRGNSLPPAPTPLPGPPPPLPPQHHAPPPQMGSPQSMTQSPPPGPSSFQAPPPPPSSAPPQSSYQSMYQNNAENQLPPPPSAYQHPPLPNPQQQPHSVPVGGIFPGPSTTSVYPGPPPKPPQMVSQHHGWQ